MKTLFYFFFTFSYFLFPQKEKPYNYGTASEEALAMYHKGWEQILDKGEWTKAEESFRKAVELDPGFLLAWSQVGRISQSPAERSEIFQRLSAENAKASGWEKKLLEVYLASLQLIDSKDRGLSISTKQVKNFYALSELNFSDFLNIYPDEIYVNSELIEVIHGIYGPAAALDSLQNQIQKGGSLNPFLISYTAQMQAETKNFELALQTAKHLESILKNPDLPIIPFTYAFIHFEKGAYQEARNLINRTLELDKNHTLAQRMRSQLEAKLN